MLCTKALNVKRHGDCNWRFWGDVEMKRSILSHHRLIRLHLPRKIMRNLSVLFISRLGTLKSARTTVTNAYFSKQICSMCFLTWQLPASYIQLIAITLFIPSDDPRLYFRHITDQKTGNNHTHSYIKPATFCFSFNIHI